MSTILLDRNKFRNLIKEADKNVTGDSAAAAGARGEMAGEKAKEIIRSMGAAVPDLEGIYSVPQLQVEPFQMTFTVQDLTDNPQELTLPKTKEFNGLARVVKDSDNLVLEIKPKDSEQTYMMRFINNGEIYTVLPGTAKKIPALVTGREDGKFYNVEFNPNFGSIVKSEKGNEEGEGEGEEGGKEGEGKDEGGKEGKGKDEGGKEGQDKKANYYNGKDLKEVNLKLSDLKDKARFFTVIKQYKDDPDFQRIFLDAIINTTKSVKINQKPLLVTLKDLKSNGLLEAPEEMSGLKRKFLKIKLNLQNFMVEVFSIFAKVAKSGKQSKTFEVIKKFYKELFLIATKGKTSISDEQTRKQLWKKLLGTFSNFLSALSKLPEMIKGNKKPDEGKEVKVKNAPKANINTMEYYINQIAKGMILKEEDGEEEQKEGGEKENKGGNTSAEIYLNNITLGPKAIEKRDGDIQTTFGGGAAGAVGKKGLTLKNMKDQQVYNVTGKIAVKDADKNIPEQVRKITEIMNLINTVDKKKLKIVKTKEGDTFILGNRDKNEGVLIIKPKDKLANLVSGNEIPVTIGSKALGKKVNSFEGTLILNLDK